MVLLEKTFADQQAARRVVRCLGVPDAALVASEVANPELDWEAVVRALDGVFLNHGGSMGQLGFLRTPQEALRGLTPVEALAERGGPVEVCRAARAFAVSARVRGFGSHSMG